MTGKESPRPEQSGTQRPLRQALVATVLFLALLAGVVAAGAGLSGNWSVSTAWNRAVAAVTARPEYRVALSLFEDGGSAEFARELLEAELDSAAEGEGLFFLPVRDLLETAAAFDGVRVEEIALTGTGFTARLRGEEAELRQAEERLRRMRVYAAVELEEDPGSPGVTRLTCVEAGAKEEE